MAPRRPEEELYDLDSDPHELNNLARSPEHRTALDKLQTLLDAWIADTRDKGLRQIGTAGIPKPRTGQ